MMPSAWIFGAYFGNGDIGKLWSEHEFLGVFKMLAKRVFFLAKGKIPGSSLAVL